MTELETRVLVIQGRPDGPRTYLLPDDVVQMLLKQELTAAFERAEQVVENDDGGRSMTREERKLLSELVDSTGIWLRLCMRIMDRSASVIEQRAYAERIIATRQLMRPQVVAEMVGVVIDCGGSCECP